MSKTSSLSKEVKREVKRKNLLQKSFVPSDHGWSLLPDKDQLPTRMREPFKLCFARVNLYLSEKQKGSTEGGDIFHVVDGAMLCSDLVRNEKRVLSASVLEYFLKNQESIPCSIPKYDNKGMVQYICFWGSLYETLELNRGIRCMYWDDIDEEWKGVYRFLANDFHSNYPALCMFS